MGDIVECSAQFKDQTSEGKALLETEELIFRGEFRVKIPLNQIKSVKAQAGKLIVSSPQGVLILDLGQRAQRWAGKSLNPKTVIDKLGIKTGQRVSVMGVDDDVFLAKLSDCEVELFNGKLKKDSDIIFLMANEPKTLERLVTLKSSIKRNGAIWVVFPKGKQDIKEIEVLQKGREAGLVDTKVVAFSAELTAHKFVIPVNDR